MIVEMVAPVRSMLKNINHRYPLSMQGVRRRSFDEHTFEDDGQIHSIRVLESGAFNQRYLGRTYRYAGSVVAEPLWCLFTGPVKPDLEPGKGEGISFGPCRYGSKAPIAPRINAREGDDGYLVSCIAEVENDRSKCVLIDAEKLAATPVSRIVLPQYLPWHALGLGQRKRHRGGPNTDLAG
jgi:carotenoid cleavage dioxygenase